MNGGLKAAFTPCAYVSKSMAKGERSTLHLKIGDGHTQYVWSQAGSQPALNLVACNLHESACSPYPRMVELLTLSPHVLRSVGTAATIQENELPFDLSSIKL